MSEGDDNHRYQKSENDHYEFLLSQDDLVIEKNVQCRQVNTIIIIQHEDDRLRKPSCQYIYQSKKHNTGHLISKTSGPNDQQNMITENLKDLHIFLTL